LDVRGILLHIGLNFLYIVQKKGVAFRFLGLQSLLSQIWPLCRGSIYLETELG